MSAALLVPFLAVATGVPIPSVSPHKTAERYPCEACHCGCTSAEQCWRHCCCYTLAQRLAWARENDVRPPGFAIAEAEQAGLDVSDWVPGSDCCQSSVAKICCTKRIDPAAKATCCSHQKSAQTAATSQATCCSRTIATPQAEHKSDYIIGWRAMKCHGQSLDTIVAVPMLVDTRSGLTGELPFAYWLHVPARSVSAGVALLPPVPPPEVA